MDALDLWLLALGSTLGVGLGWVLHERVMEKSADVSPVIVRGAWSAPSGCFHYLGRRCEIVDDGYFDGSGWRDGVLAHYVDDAGAIRSLYLTPAQWQRVKRINEAHEAFPL